jgi:hypothetical protein
MQGQERLYFAAVSLNNSAILLVERGQYRRASTVLHDSMLAILEATLVPSSCSVDDRESTSMYMKGPGSVERGTLALEGAVSRASRFVMDSAPSSTDSKRAPRVDIEFHVLDVDAPRLAMKSGRFPSATLTLLRIDAPRYHEIADENTIESHLALLSILYNFAAAALLHPLAEQDLRHRALNVINRAFHIAYSFLVGNFAASGGPFLGLVALQLSTMMAQCHYQLHVDLGDSREAWNSLSHYQLVHLAMAEETQYSNPLEGLCKPHAKAA